MCHKVWCDGPIVAAGSGEDCCVVLCLDVIESRGIHSFCDC